jgi:hypothetical protein
MILFSRWSKRTKSLILLAACLLVLVGVLLVQSANSDILNDTLAINEVVTSNTYLPLGTEEQYYDYIEIKNISDEAVNLSEYALSDDLGDIAQFPLPDVVLQPDELFLVYASGENSTDGDECHANFKLDSDGGVVLISQNDKVVAKVYIPELNDNIAYGLNASSQYVYFNVLTPGTENGTIYYKSMSEIQTVQASEQDVIITELSAGGQESIYDEDGDFSDFIELYNQTDHAVNLKGYYLSDDNDEPYRFALPDMELEAGEYVVVFASGKDRTDSGYVHLNFKLSANETLSLYNPEGELVDRVEVPTLTDGLSYGRNIDDADEWLYYSSPTPGQANDTVGQTSVSDAKETKGALVYISEVMSANGSTVYDADGDAEDWIELYNQSDHTISLAGWYLSDSQSDPQKWSFDADAEIEPGESLVIFASGKDEVDEDGNYHTNFKLEKLNETVSLSDGNVIVDRLSYGEMKGDVSIGICSDGSSDKCYFTDPTPGKTNTSTFFSGISGEVFFSEDSGRYAEAQTITISCLEQGVTIYYTLDGSMPTTSSACYTQPIVIQNNTPLRAISYKQGELASDATTATYLIGEADTTLPIVFLTSDNDNLFDGGIYNSNLYDDRRVEANIELLETDGTGFSDEVLISKSGNMSVFAAQKSFSVFFKEYVGSSSLSYNLFPDEADGVTEFKSFLLRTSGNDWDDLKCKDGMLQTLAATEMDLDYQSYRPAILYINGEYWGIYNIRDKINGDYIASHHPGVDADNVDIISFGYGVEEGTYTEYYKMINFIRTADLNDADNWQTVEDMIDVDNLIDTYLCHIYYGNFDTVNIRWWRERKEGAKWRWIVYDLDYALYLPNQNNLKLITDPEGHGVNKYFDSSLIYNLMQSKYFQERFMERTSAYWKTIFNADTMLKYFDETYQVIAAEMPRQLARWDIDYDHFADEMSEADNYIRERPAAFRKMFQNYFNLSEEELDELLPVQTITYPKIVLDSSAFLSSSD